MALGTLEYLQQRKLHPDIARRHADASFKRIESKSGVHEYSTQLLPEERLLLMAIIYASTHHKLHNAHRVIRQEPHNLINIPFLVDDPDIVEEHINAFQTRIKDEQGQVIESVHFSERPDLIALAKATRIFGLDEERIYKGDATYVQEVMEYSKLLWWYCKRFFDTPLKPKYPRNMSARHLPSVSQDVMIYQHVGSEDIPIHQQKDLTSTKAQYEYLFRFFGLDTEKAGQQSPVALVVRDGVAIHDLFSGVAFVARREESFHYDGMSEELLRGYLYGANALPTDSETRKHILQVWNMFTPEERSRWFKSWNPEIGIDPSVTAKVNGALPNQVPILWLGRSDLKGLLLSGKKGEAIHTAQNMLDIVTGNTTHLPVMLRAMIQILASKERTENKLQSATSKWFARVATATNTVFEKPVLPEHVVDLTSYLQIISADDEYVGNILPALLPIRQ